MKHPLHMLSIWIVLIAMLVMCPISAQANSLETPEMDIDSQLDALGRDELMDSVPEEARDILRDSGLSELSPDSLTGMTPQSFFGTLWNLFMEQVKKPARTLGAIFAVILMCMLLESLKTAAGEQTLSGVFQTVSVLCVLGFIAVPVTECITRTAGTVRNASLFMLSFVPIFSASMVSAGQPVTGATYSVFLLAVCQLVGQIAGTVLIPLMSVYLALCVAGAFFPGTGISAAAGAIKSAVSWILGFMLTLFVTLLSLQTVISQGADGVTVKAAKFLIGSVVPVVGSVLSDAYVAAQGCLRLVRTTVGAYGILVAIFTFLPTLLSVLAWYAVAKLAAVSGEIAGVEKVTGILRSCANVLGVLIAVMFCFALLVVVSTAVVLAMGAV